MNDKTKQTVQTIAKWTTIGGSAVIGVGAFMEIGKSMKAKKGISAYAMPAVTLLVAVSAFSWAATQPVTLIPRTA